MIYVLLRTTYIRSVANYSYFTTTTQVSKDGNIQSLFPPFTPVQVQSTAKELR